MPVRDCRIGFYTEKKKKQVDANEGKKTKSTKSERERANEKINARKSWPASFK